MAMPEGKLTNPPSPPPSLPLSVKKRIEKRLASIKEEANVLLPSLGDKLERVWEKLQPHCTSSLPPSLPPSPTDF